MFYDPINLILRAITISVGIVIAIFVVSGIVAWVQGDRP